MDLNRLILKNLHYNEEFSRKVLPFIQEDYFNERSEKLIFNEIKNFITEYSNLPTYESIIIQLEEKNISDDEYKDSMLILGEFHDSISETVELDWLVDKTENFCQEKAIYNAVIESISILDNKHPELSKGSIPKLLSDALSVSFDSSIGHEYFDDSESRYDYYHRKEEKLPFNSEWLNKITNGGLSKKTLNVILAGPHTGKSLVMCDWAANFQLSGKNVLYITCEMAEEEIAKRIDANLLNVYMDDLVNMTKDQYDKKIKYVKSKTVGKMYIKEYPTSVATVNHFRTLLNELRLKKNFSPDIIFVDYLNIASSSRMKMSGSVNSYTYVQAIAQELRGLAQENNIPIVTATQTTRGGSTSSDIDMTDISESFGVAGIADFMIGLIVSDELKELNQIMVKQLKNRYRDMNLNKRFVLGIDRPKMRIYDVEDSAQDGLVNTGSPVPVYGDEASFGKKFIDKKKFEGFKT